MRCLDVLVAWSWPDIEKPQTSPETRDDLYSLRQAKDRPVQYRLEAAFYQRGGVINNCLSHSHPMRADAVLYKVLNRCSCTRFTTTAVSRINSRPVGYCIERGDVSTRVKTMGCLLGQLH